MTVRGPEPDRRRPRGPWRPGHLDGVAGGAAPLGAAEPAAGQPDLYVVVDELDELGCRLTVDAWPAVDADGRLVFTDATRLVTVPPARLHAAISDARRRAGEPAPDRPLRIGDVIAVWRGPSADQLLGMAAGLGGGDVGPLELVDITSDARQATNAAAQAAAGDVLTAADLAALGMDVGLEDGPDSGPDDGADDGADGGPVDGPGAGFDPDREPGT